MLGAGALVGGWVGPEATAARPSRAQDVRISTFLLVLEGAQATFNDAALGSVAVHPAAANARGGSELSAHAVRATALRGLAQIAHCGDECGSRLCGVVAVENDDAVGATADLAKGSATQRSGSARAEPRAPVE